jgi:putative ABC transport system substrate-binding protein
MVLSFNRPGGNVTGISSMNTELTAKRLGLLYALLPAAARFAVLVNPSVPGTAASVTARAQATASTTGQQIEVFTASTNEAPPQTDEACFRVDGGSITRRSEAELAGV